MFELCPNCNTIIDKNKRFGEFCSIECSEDYNKFIDDIAFHKNPAEEIIKDLQLKVDL
jgi:adenylate cyclase class IV